jgi:formylglycine-generating enzyme required for sulfatase activity
VWEWCEDYYDADYYNASPTVDPTGPKSSLFGYRVLRGGSIYYKPVACRSGSRAYFQSSRTEKHIGFRPILPVEAVPAKAAE